MGPKITVGPIEAHLTNGVSKKDAVSQICQMADYQEEERALVDALKVSNREEGPLSRMGPLHAVLHSYAKIPIKSPQESPGTDSVDEAYFYCKLVQNEDKKTDGQI